MSTAPHTFRGISLPEHLEQSLRDYVDPARRGKPGGFLRAVLCNDLAGAVGKADPYNLAILPAAINWVVSYAPPESWGSPGAVSCWLAQVCPYCHRQRECDCGGAS